MGGPSQIMEKISALCKNYDDIRSNDGSHYYCRLFHVSTLTFQCFRFITEQPLCFAERFISVNNYTILYSISQRPWKENFKVLAF